MADSGYNYTSALEHENRLLRREYDRVTNGQLSREDLKTMTPAEINAAREAGRLHDILTNKDGAGNYGAKIGKGPVGEPLTMKQYIENKEKAKGQTSSD